MGGRALLKLQPWACSSALPRSTPLLPQKDTQIPLEVTALLKWESSQGSHGI